MGGQGALLDAENGGRDSLCCCALSFLLLSLSFCLSLSLAPSPVSPSQSFLFLSPLFPSLFFLNLSFPSLLRTEIIGETAPGLFSNTNPLLAGLAQMCLTPKLKLNCVGVAVHCSLFTRGSPPCFDLNRPHYQ